MSSEMPTRYDATEVEPKWYAAWEKAGLFQPDEDPSNPRYTITIPPPNITGSLHMGHALCYPLQDVYGRFQRLQGMSVLIIPGQDHAGIATQSVVEKLLRSEGTSGSQIGREKFLERVWAWREESGGIISGQLRSLGCAFDWSRSRFTMDSEYASAVSKVFIDWFERGLIYRGKRVVNWDPVLKTSVSDIETERKTIRGKLYYIRYPFADGAGSVTIATTRPETMLADVAVAVHSSDKRYEGLVGRKLILPLVNRQIPLIADQYPDPSFGSGAVKITPAHDPNDYEVGIRHGLDMPVLLTNDGKITSVGMQYEGMDRYEARKRVIADLETADLLEKVEDYDIPVLLGERSGEVIEPLLSEQWFVKQTELAQRSIQAVESGTVAFHPSRYNGIFLDWMQNIRDWCVSRQLWWGHRIPVYYDGEGTAYAALSWEDAQAKAGTAKIVRQDDDVLDTWFSSGLWPFATLGWPQGTEDLNTRYPTSLLITDRNIINLWVARMMMMGFDQAGAKPFSDVMIYATVLNEQGRRMSKSLGTGVDPMGVIEKVGADCLRHMLLSQTGQNQDLRYSEKKIDESRNFSNKIWNAARFVLMHLDRQPPKPEHFEPADLWLLSRLAKAEEQALGFYRAYELQGVCQTLYSFFWNDYCDWYIEVTKSRLSDQNRQAAPQWVLWTVMAAYLRMLHPIMPHLTEEIHSHLPGCTGLLMAERWPEIPAWFRDDAAEERIDRVFELVRAFRALRADLGVSPIKPVATAYIEGNLQDPSILCSQGWVSELRSGKPPEGRFLTASSNGVDVHLPIIGLIDEAKLRESTLKAIEKGDSELTKVTQRLEDNAFLARANSDVIERDREAAKALESRLANLKDRLESLAG